MRDGAQHMPMSIEEKVVSTHLGEVSLLATGAGHSSAVPLVLLHGMLATKEFWTGLIRDLPAHWHILAPDLWSLAHPHSEEAGLDFQHLAEMVEALRLSLAIPSLHLVAQDMGSLVLLRYAHAYPHIIRRLAFFSPALYPDQALPAGLKWWRRPVADTLMSGPLLPRMLKKFYARSTVQDADLAQPLDAALKAFQGDAGRTCLEQWIHWGHPQYLFWDHPRMLRSIRNPVLIVYGDSNPFVHYSQVERLGHHLENTQIAYLSNCGHFPSLDMPARVRQTIVQFLADTQQDRIDG